MKLNAHPISLALTLQLLTLLLSITNTVQEGFLAALVKKLAGKGKGIDGKGGSALVDSLDKLLAGGNKLRSICLADEDRAFATIGEITKGMSFYLDMGDNEAEELKRTASCLTDAYTPEKANANQICNPKAGVKPYHETLRDYMLECDDVVHYRVLTVNAGAGATQGCVVNLFGKGMWANSNVNLELNSPVEDFNVVEGFKCGARNMDQNLKTVAVMRRMCFQTRNMIMNKDLKTGQTNRNCDVTMLKLAADTELRNQMISCAIDSMTSARQNPDNAINKCRCFARSPYRRTVSNCTSQVERPERCQDLAPASLEQKYSLGYLGSCLRDGGENAYGPDQRAQYSCLYEVRSGRTAVDERTIADVRDFLIRCDQTILNTVYNSDDGCVYRVSGNADYKWNKPQNTKITRNLAQSDQAETAELISVNRVLECPTKGKRTLPVNVRRENQNRQLLNIWRSSCNIVEDLLAGSAEGCAVCRFAILQRMTPELQIAPRSPAKPRDLDDYAKNVFDCVKGLMDQWYSDPTDAFVNCLDKELDGINPDMC